MLLLLVQPPLSTQMLPLARQQAAHVLLLLPAAADAAKRSLPRRLLAHRARHGLPSLAILLRRLAPRSLPRHYRGCR